MRFIMSREKSVSPASNIKALTTSDSVDFEPAPRGIMIVGTGNIVFVNTDDTTTTIASSSLATGLVLPLSPKRINATGTTVTTIYGVY